MSAPVLYKVVGPTGEPIHSGTGAWSLPVGDQPGEWREVTGGLEKCHNGLHLTDTPALWWKPGCRIFVAEAEGVEGSCADDDSRKVVCRRARLVREVSREDQAALQIYYSGEHNVTAGAARASGSASVRASGSASVRASGSASVRAYDSASVVAYGSASVEAYDSASVRVSGSASVEAYDSASVAPAGDVTVISWRGKPGAKIVDRAVWIDRSGAAPVVYTAAIEAALRAQEESRHA